MPAGVDHTCTDSYSDEATVALLFTNVAEPHKIFCLLRRLHKTLLLRRLF